MNICRKPDIFDAEVQERLNDVNIDLFYDCNKSLNYLSEHENEIRELYKLYKYFSKRYKANEIDEYCECVLTIFFDETYTVEDNLDYRINQLSLQIKLIDEGVI